MVGPAVTLATVKFRSQLKHNSYLKTRRKTGLLSTHFCKFLACTRKSLVKTLLWTTLQMSAFSSHLIRRKATRSRFIPLAGNELVPLGFRVLRAQYS